MASKGYNRVRQRTIENGYRRCSGRRNVQHVRRCDEGNVDSEVVLNISINTSLSIETILWPLDQYIRLARQVYEEVDTS